MDPVITAPELQAALAGEFPPHVLDVRWSLTGPPGRAAYERGHLPGAQFVDLDADLAAAPGPGGRHPLPPLDQLEALVRRLGISAGRDVVCYDQNDGTAAARCWWTLRYLGHDRVRLLDGGYDAWAAGEGDLVTGAEAATSPGGDAPFAARPDEGLALDAAGAAETARSGVLLDARAAARYRGEEEPIDPVAGHIPGAVSAPTLLNVDGGHWLPADALRRRFTELGVEPGAPVGVYCGSGVTAAHEVVALERAGIRAALYVGSWSEWITDPTRAVATGADPG